LPQVNLPFGTLNGCPIGLSMIAARGNDEMLLDIAVRLGAVEHAGVRTANT
jgi:amidase